MKTLPIHELFHTFQGEGIHMGLPAFFIRTYGCPVQCPWCDSAGTWHKNYLPKDIERIPQDSLAVMADNSRAGIVVLTGGEPAIHDFADLSEELKKKDIRFHIETSGAFTIKGPTDWITLSPKKWKPPIEANLMLAQEIKIIVEEPEDIPLYLDMVMFRKYDHQNIWLHPEWSQRENPVVLNAIARAVKQANGRLRAGYQIHKLYKVDLLDERSAMPVPLGGDMKKGW